MTIDIKKSWFDKNSNRPKKIKRFMRKYGIKKREVRDILHNARTYKISLSDEFITEVITKYKLYDNQYKKLDYFLSFNREWDGKSIDRRESDKKRFEDQFTEEITDREIKYSLSYFKISGYVV